nr:glycosyltransferase [Rhodospirillales bacterium]
WDLQVFFNRLRNVLHQQSPDVIYSFMGTPNVLSVLSRLFIPSTRIVWGVRASNMDLDRYDWLSRWNYWLECRLARFADTIITNSQAGLEYAVAQGFPEKRVKVIHNGIDTKQFKLDKEAGKRLRRTWGVTDDQKLIGLVARIDPMKDHPTFLKTAALIKQREPNARFVCVGKGNSGFGESMHNLATELGLDDVLIWARRCSDMVAVYNAFDIAVSSSYGEGFPNVIGEAMACGVPCVVTDVGDSALLIGETGIVVPPNDSGALFCALDEMLSLGPTRYRSLAVAARERVESRFALDNLVNATEDVLCGLK